MVSKQYEYITKRNKEILKNWLKQPSKKDKKVTELSENDILELMFDARWHEKFDSTIMVLGKHTVINSKALDQLAREDNWKKRVEIIESLKADTKRVANGTYHFATRCDCGSYSGITEMGFSSFKIWNCDRHGFICPFDDWQYKTIEELESHLHRQRPYFDDGICEGEFMYGNKEVEVVLFEIKVYKERQQREKIESVKKG